MTDHICPKERGKNSIPTLGKVISELFECSKDSCGQQEALSSLKPVSSFFVPMANLPEMS